MCRRRHPLAPLAPPPAMTCAFLDPIPPTHVFSQPTITNVDKTDVYTLTITPATNIGAYPVGGWTIIRVMPNKDAPNPNDPPIWYPVTDCM